jgi:hypothetical protein
MRSSGFRVLFSEEGIPYIKGVVFPPFAFLHPLLPHTQHPLFLPILYPLSWPPMLKISSVLLVKLVAPPSGTSNRSSVSSLIPLLRTQYVFLFILFNSAFSNVLLFFFSEQDAHLLGSQSY